MAQTAGYERRATVGKGRAWGSVVWQVTSHERSVQCHGWLLEKGVRREVRWGGGDMGNGWSEL